MRIHRVALAVIGLAAAGPALAAPSVETIARNCVVCHGPKEAGQAEIPTLANYPAKKMVEMLSGFKADQKPATIMNRITKAFSDEQIQALATLLGKP
jgi:cytochrome c553